MYGYVDNGPKFYGLRQPKRKQRKPCRIEGCETPSKGYGLCNVHYQRMRKGKLDPGPAFEPTEISPINELLARWR